jgi:outer membrane protein
MRNFLITLLIIGGYTTLSMAQSQGGQIAFVDIEYVVSKMPETAQMQQKLSETRTRLQNEYVALQKQFEQEYAAYNSKASTMADTTRQRVENRLLGLDNQIQSFSQEAEKTISNTQKFYMGPLYLKIGNAINAVASQNGYLMILPSRINNQMFLLYADKRYNVSDKVIEAMGAAPEEKK